MRAPARYALRDVLKVRRTPADWPAEFLAQMQADGLVTVENGVIEPTLAAEAAMKASGFERTRPKQRG